MPPNAVVAVPQVNEPGATEHRHRKKDHRSIKTRKAATGNKKSVSPDVVAISGIDSATENPRKKKHKKEKSTKAEDRRIHLTIPSGDETL